MEHGGKYQWVTWLGIGDMWQREKEIESHEIPWKVMEVWRKGNCIYLLSKQNLGFRFFCALVCFACLVSSELPSGWYSGEKCYYQSHTFISQQVWLLAHHHLPLRPNQGYILGYIFPKQSGNPLTRNWTRQPEASCLSNPKQLTITTSFANHKVRYKFCWHEHNLCWQKQLCPQVRLKSHFATPH